MPARGTGETINLSPGRARKEQRMDGAALIKLTNHLAAKGLLVYMGIQNDGTVYELDTRSKERITKAYPEVNQLPMIMLGHKRDTEFERLHPPLWGKMVQMLTGLTKGQIARLGGVRIFDMDNDLLRWEWLTDAAKE